MHNLRADALRIWHAGLEAVDSRRLMREAMMIDGRWLLISDQAPIDLDQIDRIAVVGAGKAGAGMAEACEEILGPRLLEEKQVTGWLNVPADCVKSLRRIHLHAGRPAGVNEPTEAGVVGAERILQLVAALGPTDLCLCLLSGGGSALLPAPIDGISLADKLAVTRYLSAAGADIAELNTVRKQLSCIKGGRLAEHCRAGRMISLIISDIPGDPLDLIASGPTVPDTSTAADALGVVGKFDHYLINIPATVLRRLIEQAKESRPSTHCVGAVTNIIIGNNARAVDAAGMEAERLGYAAMLDCARAPEGPVEEIGRRLVQTALEFERRGGPDCLITGGEGTVKLAPARERGLGGRNQQLALAALMEMIALGASDLALVSGGTDGEDGPTDAAGAIVDAQIIAAANNLNLDPADFLRRNDAYRFFESTGGLLKTGPTHTNVCDLRVLLRRK